MSAVEIITSLSLLMGVSWCAGINLYATIGVLGLLHRYTGFNLPTGMEVLANDWVMWTALVLYTVEFVADKVPAVDSVWDAVHTFIRVPAGAVLAAMAVGEVPLEMQMVAGLIGGTLAFGSHSVKATTRLAAHGTATSPVVSPVVSVIEDVFVIGFVSLMAASPILALGVLLLAIIGCVWLMIIFWKIAKRVFRSLFKNRNIEPPTIGGPPTNVPANV